MRISENIKSYLPFVQFQNESEPTIPEIPKEVNSLLNTIHTMPILIQGEKKRIIRPLDQCVKELEKEARNLEEAKSSEVKRKILSIAALVGYVVLIGVVAASIFLFIASPLNLILLGVCGAGVLISVPTLLPAIIENIKEQFSRVAECENRVKGLVDEAKNTIEATAVYLDRLYNHLTRELEVREAKTPEERALIDQTLLKLKELQEFYVLQTKPTQVEEVQVDKPQQGLPAHKEMGEFTLYKKALNEGSLQVSDEEIKKLAQLLMETQGKVTKEGFKLKLRDHFDEDRAQFLGHFIMGQGPEDMVYKSAELGTQYIMKIDAAHYPLIFENLEDCEKILRLNARAAQDANERRMKASMESYLRPPVRYLGK